MPTYDHYVVAPARGVTWTKSIRQGVDFVLAGSIRDLLVASCAIPREPGTIRSWLISERYLWLHAASTFCVLSKIPSAGGAARTVSAT